MTEIFITKWYDFPAIVLESGLMQVVIVPDLGAKIVSLFDKMHNHEWLVPPVHPLKRTVYGADFVSQNLSGWDEMFPTINACVYPGTGDKNGIPLPDHGEVWSLPWKVERAGAGKLILGVDGPILPYRLTRTMEFIAPATLQLSYQLVNIGQDSIPYIWAAHPQFVCDQDMEIIFPPQVKEVVNVMPESWGWGVPDTRFDWPETITQGGNHLRMDRIGSPSLHKARKVFLPPEVRSDWVGLLRQPSKDWMCMEWDSSIIPYLGLWIDEGAISTETVVAPEPMTGFYDSLEVAWNKKRVSRIGPGAIQSWMLTVRFGTGNQPFQTDY